MTLSEPLHKIARENGITFYAPVRKMNNNRPNNNKPR